MDELELDPGHTDASVSGLQPGHVHIVKPSSSQRKRAPALQASWPGELDGQKDSCEAYTLMEWHQWVLGIVLFVTGSVLFLELRGRTRN